MKLTIKPIYGEFHFLHPHALCVRPRGGSADRRPDRRLGAGRVLIVYGQGSVVRSGLLDRVKDSLTKAGVEFEELEG